jgi:hypothetical protein
MNFSRGDSCPLRIRLCYAPAMRFPPVEIQENYRALAKSWSDNHPAEPLAVLLVGKKWLVVLLVHSVPTSLESSKICVNQAGPRISFALTIMTTALL